MSNKKSFEKLPPQDVEAEKAVLGAILLENKVISEVLEIINENDFYRESHRVIFKAMRNLYNRNEVVDLITIVDVLKKDNKLDDVGGIAYVTALMNVVSTAANAKYHANIIYKKSMGRKLINISTEIASKAFDDSDEIDDQIDYAEKKILEISTSRKTSDYRMANDMLLGMADRFVTLTENRGKITGLPTGFKELDNITSGLQSSDLIILAARPSIGKTALVLNIVQYLAIHAHKEINREEPFSIAIFSLEMSGESLMDRMLCAESPVDFQKMRTGQLGINDWEKIWVACDAINKTKIAIVDNPGMTVMEMRSKSRKIKSERGLDLIVVDYLQLMSGSKKLSPEYRHYEVSEISRFLKDIARELKVPVIALSQLSRSVESRNDKRPMLSDLRDSGSIEQDADLVWLLYREDYYNPDTENKNITELIIAKNRNGPVGTVKLFFDKRHTKFLSFNKDI